MMTHEDRVRHHYDDIRNYFYNRWDKDHIRWRLEPAEYPEVAHIDEVIRPLDINEDTVILDTGCGTGGACRYLKEKFNCTVIGIDLNPNHISACKQRSSGIEFIVHNLSTGIPLDSNSVDFILNFESACQYKDRETFVKDCHRVLKVDGYVSSSDWMKNDGLSEDEVKKYIDPIDKYWATYNMESPESNKLLYERNRFEVMESTGYNGREKCNIKYLRGYYENNKDTLSYLKHYPEILEGCVTLADAWERDYYVLHRFLARRLS